MTKSRKEALGKLPQAEQLTFFAVASRSHASRTAQPGKEKPVQTKGTYGESSPVSLAKLSPDGLWLRMYRGYCQARTDGSLEEYSGTWPKSGMMRNGLVSRLPILAHRTKGSGSLLLPTPMAAEHKMTPMKEDYAYRPFTKQVPDTLAMWAVRKSGLPHARLVASLWEWAMGFNIGWTRTE